MTVFVVTHKDVKLSIPQGYKIIQVGAANHRHFSSITDDTGINISDRNQNYCELTAQYWIWKNYNDDVVGLCHYRRFFYSWPAYILRTIFGIKTKMIDSYHIQDVLKSSDAIVTIPCHLSKTVWERYKISHYIEHLENAKNAILNIYPDYAAAFDFAMNRKKYHYGNMIICSKALFNSYSKWLFDILFEVEKKTDLKNRNIYQQRAYGFLSERLLDVFLIYNNVRIKEYPVVLTDEPFLVVQIVKFIKRKIKRFLFHE